MPDCQLLKVRVRFDRPRVDNLEQAVREQFDRHGSLFKQGASVAVAVGSRGISNLQSIVRAAVASLKAAGARPFIVPAMGSHGNATAEGQEETLTSYGITDNEVGCPVRSSMEVAELDHGDLPHPLYMDRLAHESDGVLLINRVKLHTDFRGRHESGLVKMAVIGLGKEKQAAAIHRFGVVGLRDHTPKAAERIFKTGKILAGLAIVENAYEDTARLELIPGGEILQREAELLKFACEQMPRFPVDDFHLLILDRMGKDVSGSGMDTNIIGRLRIIGEPEFRKPFIRAIMVNDLTPASHGNAIGMGLADVITRQLFDKIDWNATHRNLITSTFLERGKTPLVADTAAEAYRCALRSCGMIPEGKERVIRARDTLHLDEVYASPVLCAEFKERDDIEILGDPVPMFDDAGALRPF